MSSKKPVILISTGYYLPGHKGGGPVQSIANMVHQLSNEFEFRIVTPDRDFGDTTPYPDIECLTWLPVGAAHVLYLPPGNHIKDFRAAVASLPKVDLLYLNGFFHPKYTIVPLLLHKLRLLKNVPVIVAARGDFSPGIFNIKRYKKLPYTLLARAGRFYSSVTWHATSELEILDIRRWFGSSALVHSAPNITLASFTSNSQGTRHSKKTGVLRVVFISRIMKKKNLLYAIERLKEVNAEIHFTICGPLEDDAYWELCKQALTSIPESMTFTYVGSLPHQETMDILREHDVFLLPTLGENFGHAIVEALAHGVPTVISDQTPWLGLEEAKAGYSLNLTNPTNFVNALEHFAAMSQDELARWSAGSRAYIKAAIEKDSPVETTRVMLLSAMRHLET